MRVTILGGGMITHDQILPSFYHLQRLGLVDEIVVCARHDRTLQALAESQLLQLAFPGQSFRSSIGAYRDALAQTAPHNLAIIALPDHLHFDAAMAALEAGQHLLVVKPLVMKLEEAETIERDALRRGLFVGVEYHKRFDDRSLLARRKYCAGEFGEFRLGAACLMEKWYYRHSNFQNWCTSENSDAFAYIGWHLYTERWITHGRSTYATVAADMANPWYLGFFVVGVLASSFHLGVGIWNFLCKWGLAATARAQRVAGQLGVLVGCTFGLVGVLIILSFRLDWHPFAWYVISK